MSLAAAKAAAVAAWSLNEASGTRSDSVGSAHWTDHSVGSAAGKFGNAADFERDSNQYLSMTAGTLGTLLNGSTVTSVSLWLNYESLDVDGLQYENVFFWVPISSAAGIWLNLRGDGANAGKVLAGGRSQSGDGFQEKTHGAALSASTWYHLAFVFDYANDEIDIAINGTLAGASSVTFGASSYTQGTAVGLDTLGCWADSTPTPADFFDGLIDDVVLMKSYELTGADCLAIYNGGAGTAFASWDAGATKSPPPFHRGQRFMRRGR